jgi:hypothetical protein
VLGRPGRWLAARSGAPVVQLRTAVDPIARR